MNAALKIFNISHILFPVILAYLLSSPAYSLNFWVESIHDSEDSNLQDNKCESKLEGSPCTLRAAIQQINQSAGVGNIYLKPGNYQLTQGQLNIETTIAIAPDPTLVSSYLAEDNVVNILGGGVENKHRIFNIEDGKWLILANVNLKDGWTFANEAGGAIRVGQGSMLHAFRTQFLNNHTHEARGGAIFLGNDSTASLSGCIFRDNGDYYDPATGELIDNNRPARHKGGAVYASFGSSLWMNQVLMSGNEATYGGALYVEWEAKVDIFNSTIIDSKTNAESDDNMTDIKGNAIHSEGGYIRINQSSLNYHQGHSGDTHTIWAQGAMDWRSYTGNVDNGQIKFQQLACAGCHIQGNDPFDMSKFTVELLADRIYHTMYFNGKCNRDCAFNIATYIDERLMPNTVGSGSIIDPPSLKIGNSIIVGPGFREFNACGGEGTAFESMGGNLLSNWAFKLEDNRKNACIFNGSIGNDTLVHWALYPLSGEIIRSLDQDPVVFRQQYINGRFIKTIEEPVAASGGDNTPSVKPADHNAGWRGIGMNSSNDSFFSCQSKDQTGFARTTSACDAGAYEAR